MPTLNIMQTIRSVQSATMRAREATGMQGIGTRVNMGKFQVVNTTFGKRGAATVDSLSDWIDAADAVAVLTQIAQNKVFRA